MHPFCLAASTWCCRRGLHIPPSTSQTADPESSHLERPPPLPLTAVVVAHPVPNPPPILQGLESCCLFLRDPLLGRTLKPTSGRGGLKSGSWGRLGGVSCPFRRLHP
ncbi:hypothetical protein N657DRAFT_377692 [Parathielavia appendiculata]|uniref:Uncharacterized protein n=1 Tax=Parathielavia appendiculata TaxID=2587402 RepID=A0AAN6U0W7_9PEZI|nr:hypothetical protein N657DRAFT_377692 [Parathielavia appendiculata]